MGHHGAFINRVPIVSLPSARCIAGVAFRAYGGLFMKFNKDCIQVGFLWGAVTLRREWWGEWFHFRYYTCRISELPKYSLTSR